MGRRKEKKRKGEHVRSGTEEKKRKYLKVKFM